MTHLKIIILAGLLLSFSLCFSQPVQAADPGAAYPANSEVSNQKLGSILIFTLYTSSAAAPTQENTVLSITNTNVTNGANVHLFFIDTVGNIADSYLCLTPTQTANFLASDVIPGSRGYLLAVAVNNNGYPVNHNYLTGEANIKLAAGQRASLEPLAVAALNLPAFSGATATLSFDGVAYNRLPRTLAADHLKSPLNGNSTLLVITRIGGTFVGANSGAPIGSFSGQLYDDQGHAFPFSANSSATQIVNLLSNTFPNTTPGFDQVVPAGRTGWLHLNTNNDAALVGGVLNFHPSDTTEVGAFTGGKLLRALTLTANVSISIPVFPPSC